MDKFLIAPYDSGSGLQNNVRPWLIPDQAFSELNNAYVFRGRVRKRFGSKWFSDNPLLSRFRVNVGTTDGDGDIVGLTPQIAALTPAVTPAIGQAFSIGNQIFTVNAAGTPADMLISGTATLAQYEFTTGAFEINGADALTAVYFYPDLPVMGLLTYENATFANSFIIGFDTKFAYQYTNGWERLDVEDAGTPDASIWNGTNFQFFWGTTWTGVDPSDSVFFVTNFNENEPNHMRRYNGTDWSDFFPQITAAGGGLYLFSSQILLVFKNRLIALNTWEGPAAGPSLNYRNRCRYSHIGSPLDVNAFRQDLSYKTNSIDAATTEAIVSAEFLKDRLIVYFQRSTWELVYIGNQAQPFTWQKINTELGAESPFSVISFDKVVLGIGTTGIHACSGGNVERIDTVIPDEIFKIHNDNDGPFRVYGIRDYFSENVYWTISDVDANNVQPFPTRVLVYNYRNNTWAYNDDSITCFGYYNPVTGITWDSTTVTWDDDVSWDSGALQSEFRHVVAGNQQGYTFITDLEQTVNAAVLQITDIVPFGTSLQVYSVNHNLRVGDYIYIQNAVWSDATEALNNTIVMVTQIFDANNFLTYILPENIPVTGTYLGGGLISRVSQPDIRSKEYNFYAKDNRNAYISKVDFMVDRTASGQMQVNFYLSSSPVPILQDSLTTGVVIGTGNLDTFPYIAGNPGVMTPLPFEALQDRLWHPVYFQAEGEVVQLQITMNDTQMRDINIRRSDFQIHAMIISAQPTSRLQ